jgi:hypothetical protein
VGVVCGWRVAEEGIVGWVLVHWSRKVAAGGWAISFYAVQHIRSFAK